MAPSHVRTVARLYVKQLTGVHAGQPLSSEITNLGCRPRYMVGKAISGTTLFSEPFTDLAESKTLCMYGNSMLENREISRVSSVLKSERLGKVCDHNPNMYALEKSDTVIVPKKEPNKAGLSHQQRRFWRKGR